MTIKSFILFFIIFFSSSSFAHASAVINKQKAVEQQMRQRREQIIQQQIQQQVAVEQQRQVRAYQQAVAQGMAQQRQQAYQRAMQQQVVVQQQRAYQQALRQKAVIEQQQAYSQVLQVKAAQQKTAYTQAAQVRARQAKTVYDQKQQYQQTMQAKAVQQRVQEEGIFRERQALEHTDEVVQLAQVWNELDVSSEIWPQIIDRQPKEVTIQKYIDLYREEGVHISKSPSFYIDMIDRLSQNSPEMFNVPFKKILMVVAVMEYDFDNGQDKDVLARRLLGEKVYQENKRRLGR